MIVSIPRGSSASHLTLFKAPRPYWRVTRSSMLWSQTSFSLSSLGPQLKAMATVTHGRVKLAKTDETHRTEHARDTAPRYRHIWTEKIPRPVCSVRHPQSRAMDLADKSYVDTVGPALSKYRTASRETGIATSPRSIRLSSLWYAFFCTKYIHNAKGCYKPLL